MKKCESGRKKEEKEHTGTPIPKIYGSSFQFADIHRRSHKTKRISPDQNKS
jgi:hypothetical protein